MYSFLFLNSKSIQCSKVTRSESLRRKEKNQRDNRGEFKGEKLNENRKTKIYVSSSSEVLDIFSKINPD